MKSLSYHFRTHRGTFSLVAVEDGWRVFFEGEPLGTYGNATLAAGAVSSGTCDWPGTLDPGTLNVPEDLSEWSQRRGSPGP